MNYLDLCRELVKEVGIGGGSDNTPASVVNQTGELANVVRWIRDADTEIDNLWTDWNYLWFQHATTLAKDSQVPAGPTFAVRHWDASSFWVGRGTNQAVRLNSFDWPSFRDQFPGLPITARPSAIAALPDGTLKVNTKADKDYTFTAEGWKRPVALSQNADVPAMPAEFHRLILCRAGIYYANREDAPELISGFESEYIDILDKLQANCLASFQYERMSQSDMALHIPLPGFSGATR